LARLSATDADRIDVVPTDVRPRKDPALPCRLALP